MLCHAAATLPQHSRLYAAPKCRAISRLLISASAKVQPPSSAFTGVSWAKAGQKWRALISHGGKLVHLGQYASEEEAARTWDKAAVFTRPHASIQLNYPLQDYVDDQNRPLPDPRIEALLRGDPDDPALAGITKGGKQLNSAFRGVWRVGEKKWRAAIKHGGKQVHLGQYDSEGEAARTWDKAAVLSRPHDGKLKLNYPLQDYLDAQDRPLPDPRIEALLRGDPLLAGFTKGGKQFTSAFSGVCRVGRKWTVRISHGGKRVHLGHYDSEEEAARTWDKAAVLTRPHDGKLKLNFSLQDYQLPDPRIEALLRGDPALAGITTAGKQLSSAFTGVSRVGKKWKAAISHGGKQVHLGQYNSEEEAARTWDKAAVLAGAHDGKLKLKLNYPLQDYLDAQGRPLPDPRIEALLRGDEDDPALAGKTRGGKQLTSACRGVSRIGKKWQAQISHGGKVVQLGLYVCEEEAALTWDKAAVRIRPHDGIKLNYPLQDYLDAHGRPLPDPRIEALLRGDQNPALAGKSKQLTPAAL